MKNKNILDNIENEYFNKLLNITNSKAFNKELGGRDLEAMHLNQSSFKIFFGYQLVNNFIFKYNNLRLNASYITFDDNFDQFSFDDHLSFSYLTNFLRMTPFNLCDYSLHLYSNDDIENSEIHSGVYDNPKHIDSDVFFSLNNMTINIDSIYYRDNYKHIFNTIKENGDIYYLIDNNGNKINNEFILVPKGYIIDDQTLFTRDYACNHKKEGEIYFRIDIGNENFALLNHIVMKLGDNIKMIECLNHYKSKNDFNNSPSDSIMYPLARPSFTSTYNEIHFVFDQCMTYYSFRFYQVFLDDIYYIYTKMGYSHKESYDFCLKFDRYVYGNNKNDIEFKDISKLSKEPKYMYFFNGYMYRFYDDVSFELYCNVFLDMCEYKYGDKYSNLRKQIINEFWDIYLSQKKIFNKTTKDEKIHHDEVIKDIENIHIYDENKILYVAKSEIFNKTGQVKAVDTTCKTLLENVDINKVNVVDANIICSDITLKDISDIVTQIRSTLNNVDVFAHVIRKDYYRDEIEVHLIASK